MQLVHESLIEAWAKLRQWLDEDEQDVELLARLRAAAQPWEASGEAEGLLWRDRAAEEAGRWLERRRATHGAEPSSGLGRREERYLRAVVARAERARRVRRRAVAAAVAALGAIVVVVSYLALRADAQAARAADEARQARNATRMAVARELESDPTTRLALLREIEPPDVPRGWSQLSRRALQDGVAHLVLAHAGAVRSAAFSPDGSRIVTASGDRTARVWSADGTGPPIVLRGHGDTVFAAAWSPTARASSRRRRTSPRRCTAPTVPERPASSPGMARTGSSRRRGAPSARASSRRPTTGRPGSGPSSCR